MLAILFLCFLLSGFSSLVYQTLWTRALTHEVGGSPYAVAIVLTVFMGGLGLGAALGGRLADRLRTRGRLLLAYGLLELGVGLYALLLPSLLGLMRPLFAAAYGGLFGSPFLYNASVFLLCAVPLLLPILAMGATLPLLGRHQVERHEAVGGPLGLLYGVNTLGAALGVAAAGYWLLPALGLAGTTRLAAAVNAAVGMACAALGARAAAAELEEASRARPAEPGSKVASRSPHGAAAPADPRLAAATLALFALSGFCAMAYEVVWTKVLSLVMGPTTYAFTTVLVAFIGGLAFGGWACARLADRARDPALLLALAQVLAALLALAAGQRMGNSLFLFEKIDYLYHARFGTGLLLKGGFLFAFMALPTFLLGAVFPLVMRILARAGDRLGRSIGRAYAVNTLGGVLGSWSAGFLLVPYLGSERSLGILAALQAAAGVTFGFLALGPARAAAPAGPGSGRSPAKSAASAAGGGARVLLAVAALPALAACLMWPRWDREALGRAAARILGPELAEASWWTAVWSRRPSLPPPLPESQVYYGDGIGGFTSVWRAEDVLGREDFSLFVSGKADASSRRDMFTQVLLAHVPLLLHPDPKSAMVLGLASGVTAGEALRHGLDRLDVLEINPQVVEASRYFRPWNGDALADARTRLLLQDAKAHLLLSRESYDVIISEPSNPWMAGLSELFSREFFARARDRLSDGGVMVQFLHSYAMDWEVFAMVGRTFAEAFPNAMLVRTMPDPRRLSGQSSDFLLVGRKGDAPLDFAAAGHGARAALGSSRNIRLADPRLLARLVEAEDLPALFGPGPVHTDDKPLLEFAAPKVRFTYDSRAIEAAIARGARLRARTRALADSLAGDPSARLAYADFALSLYKPFPGMIGRFPLDSAAPAGRAAFAGRLEDYCANNHVTDLDFVEDPDLRLRCSVAQMAVLNRRLTAGAGPAAPLYLAMADMCLMNGVVDNAVRYLRQAVDSSDPRSPVGREARSRLDQIAAAARPAP